MKVIAATNGYWDRFREWQIRARVTPLRIALVFAILFCVFYLRIFSRWWFEDDPGQYAYVRGISNPLSCFLDPSVDRGFGNGHGFVPAAILSFWLDMHLFGPSTIAAYAHQLLSTLITFGLFYLVLRKVTENRALSAAFACLWLVLPSTMVVIQYLSTRHYMEGLGLAFVTVLFAMSTPSSGRLRIVYWIALVAAAATSMLCKEIYGVLTPVALLGIGIGQGIRAIRHDSPRKWLSLERPSFLPAVIGICLLAGYGVYRIHTVGSSIHYEMDLVGVKGYKRFLSLLPYTLCSSDDGLTILYMVSMGMVGMFVRDRSKAIAPTVFMIVLLAATLGALYPVAGAIIKTYRTSGTWYRVPFVPNTLILLWAGYVFSRLDLRWLSVGFLAYSAYIVLPGVEDTQQYWQSRMQAERAEADFYLAFPHRLLYSQEDAYWYIVGINGLFNVPIEHYVLKNQLKPEQDARLARQYGEIWESEGGQVVKSPYVYARLTGEPQNLAQPNFPAFHALSPRFRRGLGGKARGPAKF